MRCFVFRVATGFLLLACLVAMANAAPYVQVKAVSGNGLYYPGAVTTDSSGNVYTAAGTIYKYNNSGVYQGQIGVPINGYNPYYFGVAVDSDNYIWTVR